MEDTIYSEERFPSGLLLLALAVALLVAIASLVWSYTLSHQLARAEAQLQASEQESLRQATELAATDRQLRATSEEFGDKLGITQRQIEDRAQEILHQQQAATSQLARQEAETRKQVGTVSSAVSGVQTDVGGVKTELTNTEQQLQHAVGDLGVQSGLIATNQQQLDYLKHMGDRTYYQFKLLKGQPPQAIATVKLQLHKADAKHSRYTLEVFSDDKKIEKKDRSLDEPVQFYSGKQPLLYEVVIDSIGKNEVEGYLSTPKNAPQPTTVP